jgi:hypothetical protein
MGVKSSYRVCVPSISGVNDSSAGLSHGFAHERREVACAALEEFMVHFRAERIDRQRSFTLAPYL